jgi:Trypsin/Regulator of chromosome condensation (RCC1) repeat
VRDQGPLCVGDTHRALRSPPRGASSVDVDSIVVDEQDSVGGNAEAACNDVEHLPVGLHDTEFEREERVIEVLCQRPMPKTIAPMQGVRVRQATDAHPLAGRLHELDRPGKRADRPGGERLDQQFRRNRQSPIGDDATPEVLDGAATPFELADPPTRQPAPPELVIVIDPREFLHRRDPTELDEHPAQIEQHDINRARHRWSVRTKRRVDASVTAWETSPMYVGRKLTVLLALILFVAATPAPSLASETPGTGTIIGGAPVDAATVPWTVAIFQTEQSDPFLAQYCGGVLIDAGWVLTAKHCLRNPTGMQVGWAKTNLSSYSAADRRSIDAVFGHPAHDVALLRLSEPVPGAPAIDLWRDASGPSHLQRYWTYGWGTRSAVAPDFPDGLHGVEVVDRSGPDDPGPCLRYGFSYELGHHVCAGWGAGGRDACFGDSGGPLVAYTPEPQLVGITSFGTENCGDPDWPGVYERVSSSAAWIDQVRHENSHRGYWVTRGGLPSRTASPVSWAVFDANHGGVCAIATEGSLWCGSDDLAQIGSDNDWISVDHGAGHICGIKLDQSLWCWGDGHYGQLGDGSTLSRTTPTRVGSENDWLHVDAGWTNTCGLREPGTLWCWGRNHEGQLGIGSRVDSTIPAQIGALTDWIDVAASEHSCGIRSPGTMWCWGHNANGELGDGTRTRRTRPRQIGNQFNWHDVEIHLRNSCALRSGQLWCWAPSTVAGVGSTPTMLDASADWTDLDMGVGTSVCLAGPVVTLWCGDVSAPDQAPTPLGGFNDWQIFATDGTTVHGVRGVARAERHVVGLSSTDAERLTDLGSWLELDEPGALLKLGVFVDAFILAISPPAPPQAVELPPPSTQRAISVFWVPEESVVLETVQDQRLLTTHDAHRWGFQVLSFIALLNGI